MIFYAQGIFVKYIYDPAITQVIELRNVRDIPVPAMTICSPLMAKADYAPYGEFLKAQKKNESFAKFSTEEQKKLAALSQACIKRRYFDDYKELNEEPKKTVKYLSEGMSFKKTLKKS